MSESEFDDYEETWKAQLKTSRIMLKNEMQRVLDCRTQKDKAKLYADWLRLYNESDVRDLVRLAKNKDARLIVANWKIDGFDQHKRKRK